VLVVRFWTLHVQRKKLAWAHDALTIELIPHSLIDYFELAWVRSIAPRSLLMSSLSTSSSSKHPPFQVSGSDQYFDLITLGSRYHGCCLLCYDVDWALRMLAGTISINLHQRCGDPGHCSLSTWFPLWDLLIIIESLVKREVILLVQLPLYRVRQLRQKFLPS
jgi:hypothetical protein